MQRYLTQILYCGSRVSKKLGATTKLKASKKVTRIKFSRQNPQTQNVARECDDFHIVVFINRVQYEENKENINSKVPFNISS